ncbi:MAG: DDE-type integrase/transposase/recombinase [Candidatus Eisenbacteria bacterium]|nr:DDE-type integrase/transposase/recombinase [Candidatus Latescibacterota bacterium]MBD3301942.1 DDE-type integrase/transposase/recombinase [Candidatus Eisenbacteria bacterium]
MQTIMDDSQISTLEQVKEFLEGSDRIAISIASKEDRYEWVRRTLDRFQFLRLGRSDRGVLLRYLSHLSGYSRAQITRLVAQYRRTGKIERRHCRTNGFTHKYTRQDIRLLARLDEIHGTLSGPAAKKLSERAYHRFGQQEYGRLARISVSHLYNLRRSKAYLGNRRLIEKTRPSSVRIGERRKPRPNGAPGHIRVDTVHQGDLDGKKGVYHINTVDEVTQYEIVGCVERISESHLVPLLQALIEQYPFEIRGFHSDNGSEFVNGRVARLLQKLLIEFTKTRARQANDNALVEAKNGWVIRKHFGYAHIPQRYAQQIDEYCREHLNPYLNFHRPCYFPVTYTDRRGKTKKRYPYSSMTTPYEKLKGLPEASSHLRSGLTFEMLDDAAYAMSDNQAAKRMNRARTKLFRAISEREPGAA